MATRWGIAGCGSISNMFVTSWKSLPEDEHVLVAAAARDLKDAQKFVDKHNGKKAYEGYYSLATDPDIEIVYIGTLSKTHMEVVLMMLEAGKHVLCEKPLAMNVEQSRKMVDLARKKNLFLMEGLWSRCFPVYEEVQSRLRKGEIGDIVHATASLGFGRFDLPRISQKALGGSVTLDMGVYLIQFVLHVFGAEMPIKITAEGHLNDDDIDEDMSAILVFTGGRSACISATTRCHLSNEASVYGTEGIIKVNSRFNSPESFESPEGKFNFPLPIVENVDFSIFQGLMYEVQEVRRCLNEGLLESPKIPLDESILIARILEGILKELGVDLGL